MDMIRQNKKLFIFESLVFIVLGIIAIVIPSVFTFSIEFLIGILFVIGGAVQLTRSFQAHGSAEITATVISGLFYAGIGILFLIFPLVGVLSLTMLLAILFLIQGIIQIFLGLSFRELKNWVWWLFSGLISIALASIIFAEWPMSAIWFIGILVGINLLFYGFSLLFITLEA